MSKFAKLKHKYNNLVTKTLMCNKDILIESFIEYYGSEHQKTIEKRFNEIVFVYYIDWFILKKAIDSFISTVGSSKRYTDFLLFYEAKDEELTLRDKISIKRNNNLPKNYIGSTNIDAIINADLTKKLEPYFRKGSSGYFCYQKDDNNIRIVTIPILTLSEDNFINEIHTAIINKTKMNTLIDKLLMARASREIARIFRRRGGTFTSFCYGIPFDTIKYNNFYLINDFYRNYRKVIKKSLFSNDKNILLQTVGEENYHELEFFISEYYCTDIKDIEINRESYEKSVKALLSNMQSSTIN